ncbi:MAG: inorganic pyrophosphatase [Christensenellaceae bacterium]
MIGKIVKVVVDRPLGTYHPKHQDLYYSVNYGYIPGMIAPDGEEQDAYILGVDFPLKEFTGKVIAIIHRINDVEDKWVVAPENMYFTKEEIIEKVAFQEQFFSVKIIV